MRWMDYGWQTPDRDPLRKLHAPDFVDHIPADRRSDRDAFVQGNLELNAAFPDFHARVEGLVIDTEKGTVVVRWTAVGTHHGEWFGTSATNRRFTFEGIEIIRVVEGLIRERWGEGNGYRNHGTAPQATMTWLRPALESQAYCRRRESNPHPVARTGF